MVAAPVELSVAEHVATIALANPEGRNVLDAEMAEALRDAAEQVGADAEVRCAILTGTDDVFAAGADIEEIAAASAEQNLAYNARLRAAVDAVAALPIPSIAALNGHAVGGGLELALACTLRVASATARLGMPEARLGIIPATGGLARLPRLIGRSAAARLLLTGELLTGAEAQRVGIVDLAVPAEEAGGAVPAGKVRGEAGIAVPAGKVQEEARALATRIAAAAPLSTRAIVDALRSDALLPIDEANLRTEERLAALLESADRREGAAAFLEHREPRFTGS
jgi:enoyl-CoA hydratase